MPDDEGDQCSRDPPGEAFDEQDPDDAADPEASPRTD